MAVSANCRRDSSMATVADHFWPPICWKCAATVSAVMVGRSAGAKNKA